MALLALEACGHRRPTASVPTTASTASPTASTPTVAAAPQRMEVERTLSGPANGVYRLVHAKTHASRMEAAFDNRSAPHRTIFLNKDGGTFSPGDDYSSTNRSTIVDAPTKIPPYEKGAASWSAFASCMQDELARWNVTVTDRDPGAAQHLEVVVGGRPGLAGLESSVGGVSPMTDDCSLIESSIVFVFSQNLDDASSECEVAAQELGHSLGLDHEYLCADPMTYLDGCGHKTFQAVDAACGESAPRACVCGGATQSSVRVLTDRLGLAGATPMPPPPVGKSTTIDALTPEDGATLPANSTIDLGARVIGANAVFLRWAVPGDGTSDLPCASPPAGVTCDAVGDRYTWHVRVGTGVRSWAIHAIDAAGGGFDSKSRTLTLATSAAPTAGAPAVISPLEGATFAPGDDVQVRVDVAGVADVGAVWLQWTGPSGDSMYPLDFLGGTQWGVDLTVGSSAPSGPRTLGVTAWSYAGVAVQADDRGIQIGP